MTTLPFDVTLRLNGADAIYLECEIDGHVADDMGTADPYFAIDAIRVNDVTLPTPCRPPVGMWQHIAAEIAIQANTDRDILADAMRIEGWRYHGLGSNDPGGHFERVAA